MDATALFRLDGRTAFISGAAGHLGTAMAFAMAEAGVHVILNGRDGAKLKALEDSLRAQGHTAVEWAAFDVADGIGGCVKRSGEPAAEQYR